jgi:hypothetical protein
MERRSLIPAPGARGTVTRLRRTPSGSAGRGSAGRRRASRSLRGSTSGSRCRSEWSSACWCAACACHFLAAPLADVAVLTGDREPLPGAARDHWLVWQSLTGTAVTARLPTDATGLACRLRLPAGAQGALVRSMIGELLAAVFEHRAV